MSLRDGIAGSGKQVAITLDGAPVRLLEGQMLAAALWEAGHVALGVSNVSSEPRGPLCFMGICQECLVRVDGLMKQACLVSVRDRMVVERRTLAKAP